MNVPYSCAHELQSTDIDHKNAFTLMVDKQKPIHWYSIACFQN